nr:hypothetical protein [Salmonella enterica]
MRQLPASAVVFWLIAQPYGMPAKIAPPEKTSGQTASMSAAIAPPPERPVTKTRLSSIL